MNRTMLALLFPALVAVPAAAQAPRPALPLDRVAAVADSMARVQMTARGIPGITIALARDGEILFSRAYGTADVEMGAAATPETVYGITSLTKQFTAALVMRLVEQGRMSLEDSITRHLPDYPVQGRRLTIRHLLNHTSGIAPMRGTSSVADPQWFRRDLTYVQMIDLFGREPFAFEPGTRHEYNNFAYYLLGEIIGRVTGTPYAQHVDAQMAALGLAHTTYCDATRVVPGRAETYALAEGRLVHAPYVSMQVLGAGGAMCSTAADLVRWTHLLHAGQVVSPASLREMTAKTVLAGGETEDYGFGLYVDEFGGRRKVYHGGTLPWGSFLAHYPEDGLTIVVLTNGSGARDEATFVEEAMARAAFGIEIPNLPLTAEEIAGYAGTYTLQVSPERTLDVRIFGQDGQLMVEPAGQDVGRLLNQGGHVFIAEDDEDIRVAFAVEGGRAIGITLHQRGRSVPGTRKP